MAYPLTIFILSDGTGETADQMLKATLMQYIKSDLKIVRYKNIRNEAQVAAIFEEAIQSRAILAYTFVSEVLRQFATRMSQQSGVPCVDLLGPLLELLSRYLTRDSEWHPGIFHQVDENYFKRIEAIEFTVKHDDGRSPENLSRADIVLVGLSRTSKTPLSVYLSYKGWKVANVPVVKGIPLPPALFDIEQRKIIGLLISPESLCQIRRERLIKMGDDPLSTYASMDHVLEEIEYCKSLFRQNRRWPVFDVTGKALEETASDIERIIRLSLPENSP